ncbi:MAG: hypothetical protein IT371_08125 [Deltaproteobacteria bacterium]|nr:hypothetical protein [Deltaproteobacteria bacterium]
MAKKTPLQLVKELHGTKDKLVDKVVALLDRGEESKEDFTKRLLAAPNSKLLRLHDGGAAIQKRFGDKSKMVDAVLALMNRGKDKDYREKLLGLTSIRLLALHGEWERKTERAKRPRRSRAAAKAVAAKAAAAKAAAAKAAAKTPAKSGGKPGGKSGGKSAPAKTSAKKGDSKKSSGKKKVA